MDRRRQGWDELLSTGLCGDRTEHLSHSHRSVSLGEFWCTADQSQREPYRSERLRQQA